MRLCLDTIYALTFNPFTVETLQFASIDMYKVVHCLYNNIQLYLLIRLTTYLYIFVRNCAVICSKHQCVYNNASMDIPNNLKNVIQNIFLIVYFELGTIIGQMIYQCWIERLRCKNIIGYQISQGESF